MSKVELFCGDCGKFNLLFNSCPLSSLVHPDDPACNKFRHRHSRKPYLGEVSSVDKGCGKDDCACGGGCGGCSGGGCGGCGSNK